MNPTKRKRDAIIASAALAAMVAAQGQAFAVAILSTKDADTFVSVTSKSGKTVFSTCAVKDPSSCKVIPGTDPSGYTDSELARVRSYLRGQNTGSNILDGAIIAGGTIAAIIGLKYFGEGAYGAYKWTGTKYDKYLGPSVEKGLERVKKAFSRKAPEAAKPAEAVAQEASEVAQQAAATADNAAAVAANAADNAGDAAKVADNAADNAGDAAKVADEVTPQPDAGAAGAADEASGTTTMADEAGQPAAAEAPAAAADAAKTADAAKPSWFKTKWEGVKDFFSGLGKSADARLYSKELNAAIADATKTLRVEAAHSEANMIEAQKALVAKLSSDKAKLAPEKAAKFAELSAAAKAADEKAKQAADEALASYVKKNKIAALDVNAEIEAFNAAAADFKTSSEALANAEKSTRDAFLKDLSEKRAADKLNPTAERIKHANGRFDAFYMKHPVLYTSGLTLFGVGAFDRIFGQGRMSSGEARFASMFGNPADHAYGVDLSTSEIEKELVEALSHAR